MMYFAAFNVAPLVGLGSITLSTSGESNAVIDLSTITATADDDSESSIFFHHQLAGGSPFQIVGQDPNSQLRLREYAATSYASALQVAIRDELTAQSWTGPASFNVTCAAATGAYGFSYSPAFGMGFSTAAGAAFLGFLSQVPGFAATSFTSNAVPTYAIHPTLPATSLPTTNYEPAGIATRVYSDSGEGFGTARETSPLFRDWIQQYETKEKTLRRSATSAHPWTFQHLFEHCRGNLAFIVSDGFGESAAEVFALRTEGTSWKPERASPGNDAQFHIQFRASVEGAIEEEVG